MTLSPIKIARIAALREAGFSLTAIASRERVSFSTVQRALKIRPAIKGAAMEEMVAAARAELATNFADSAGLTGLYTEFVADSISQITQAREKSGMLLEQIKPGDGALGFRALAAHAVALKAHADIMRALLPAPQASNDELPSLEVVEMTQEEIQVIRDQQAAEEEGGVWGDER